LVGGAFTVGEKNVSTLGRVRTKKKEKGQFLSVGERGGPTIHPPRAVTPVIASEKTVSKRQTGMKSGGKRNKLRKKHEWQTHIIKWGGKIQTWGSRHLHIWTTNCWGWGGGKFSGRNPKERKGCKSE